MWCDQTTRFGLKVSVCLNAVALMQQSNAGIHEFPDTQYSTHTVLTAIFQVKPALGCCPLNK